MPGGQAGVAQAIWLLVFPRAGLVNAYILLTSSVLKKQKQKQTNNSTKSTSNIPVWSRGHQEVAGIHTCIAALCCGSHRGNLSKLYRASELGSREGWSKHFRSGFCKRRVLSLNPWAWQLALEGAGEQMIAAPLASLLWLSSVLPPLLPPSPWSPLTL